MIVARRLIGVALLVLAGLKLIGVAVVALDGVPDEPTFSYVKQLSYAAALLGIGAPLVWARKGRGT